MGLGPGPGVSPAQQRRTPEAPADVDVPAALSCRACCLTQDTGFLFCDRPLGPSQQGDPGASVRTMQKSFRGTTLMEPGPSVCLQCSLHPVPPKPVVLSSLRQDIPQAQCLPDPLWPVGSSPPWQLGCLAAWPILVSRGRRRRSGGSGPSPPLRFQPGLGVGLWASGRRVSELGGSSPKPLLSPGARTHMPSQL